MRTARKASKKPLPTAMKTNPLIPFAALAILLTSACNKPASDPAQKIAELEQQVAEQKLAAERDAVERERAQLDEARSAAASQQDTSAADKLSQREAALAAREGKLDQQQGALDDQQEKLERQAPPLSAQEREQAGSGSVNVPDEGTPQAAVGDYGMFYDSLTNYGSWFE